MRVGAGDLRVARHPVVLIGVPLLGRQQRQQGSQRIHRDALPLRKDELLALDGEELALDMPADRLPAIQHGFDPKVIKPEPVVAGIRRSGHPSSPPKLKWPVTAYPSKLVLKALQTLACDL